MSEENLKHELAALAPTVVGDPCANAGAWRNYGRDEGSAAAGSGYAHVFVDYGCGLGDYTVALALRDSDALFVGVEVEAFCVAVAARKALETGAANAVFAQPGARMLDELFAPGEVDGIFLCFPTPHPRARSAAARMTSFDALLAYRRILAPDGFVRLKTDSQPLRDYTLLQLAAAGYALDWNVDDLHAVLPDDPATGYEQRLAGKGAPVFSLQARPTGEPATAAPDTPESLYDYLPDDLDALVYVPMDMERSVRNLAAARRQIARRRAEREQMRAQESLRDSHERGPHDE